MALVDYSSDSDSEQQQPPPKRARVSPDPHSKVTAPDPHPGPAPDSARSPSSSRSSLPPLPAAFHDLYASTVRTSTADDPSLHQGRVRVNPHVAGNWPSHVYIEWHPSEAAYELISSLISSLQKSIDVNASSFDSPVQLSTFLTSDLGAPLPLHISLSRPITLTTADKDNFLKDLEASIETCGVVPFELSCRGVEWHRTDESGRSFLVLRVRSSSSTGNTKDEGKNDDDSANNKSKNDSGGSNCNLELTKLLRRCNDTAKTYGQPQLYKWAEEASTAAVGAAFHVSIAWSFSKPTDRLKQLTDEVFNSVFGGKGTSAATRKLRTLKIPVEGVKAKIGNVVTHIPLPQIGRRKSSISASIGAVAAGGGKRKNVSLLGL